MEVRSDASFDRDLKQIRDDDLRLRVERAIESAESASTVPEIPGIRRLKATGSFYRIRIGDYRIGVEVEGEVVILVRFGHRREVYRSFP